MKVAPYGRSLQELFRSERKRTSRVRLHCHRPRKPKEPLTDPAGTKKKETMTDPEEQEYTVGLVKKRRKTPNIPSRNEKEPD